MACVPVMVFGVSFVISFDLDNIKWYKTRLILRLIRLCIGLTLAVIIDQTFNYMY
jgi:hypothetical protein